MFFLQEYDLFILIKYLEDLCFFDTLIRHAFQKVILTRGIKLIFALSAEYYFWWLKINSHLKTQRFQ